MLLCVRCYGMVLCLRFLYPSVAGLPVCRSPVRSVRGMLTLLSTTTDDDDDDDVDGDVDVGLFRYLSLSRCDARIPFAGV
uniref:Putative secreted protein n=1 Tax=Anopheles darlingi TaxID=43151 RepID=A0A2M4DNQ8_ANODA